MTSSEAPIPEGYEIAIRCGGTGTRPHRRDSRTGRLEPLLIERRQWLQPMNSHRSMWAPIDGPAGLTRTERKVLATADDAALTAHYPTALTCRCGLAVRLTDAEIDSLLTAVAAAGHEQVWADVLQRLLTTGGSLRRWLTGVSAERRAAVLALLCGEQPS